MRHHGVLWCCSYSALGYGYPFYVEIIVRQHAITVNDEEECLSIVSTPRHVLATYCGWHSVLIMLTMRLPVISKLLGASLSIVSSIVCQ